MPLHDFMCSQGHVTEQFVGHGVNGIACPACWGSAYKVFTCAPMGFVQADICYDSPIDGRHITNKQKRLEDLARSNCVPYDPDMKQDQDARVKRDAERLEAAVDRTVDEEISKMSSRKREKLEGELAGGMDVTPQRITPNVKPLTVEIQHG